MSKRNLNPGSREAIAEGCLCPVLDNNHGVGVGGSFWMVDNCPLHGKPTPPKSLDTPTIDEILDMIGHKLKPVEMRGVKFADEIVITGKRKAKQALLQWHKSKARSYVPEKLDQDNSMTNDIYNTGHNEAIDQTLKAIEESK